MCDPGHAGLEIVPGTDKPIARFNNSRTLEQFDRIAWCNSSSSPRRSFPFSELLNYPLPFALDRYRISALRLRPTGAGSVRLLCLEHDTSGCIVFDVFRSTMLYQTLSHIVYISLQLLAFLDQGGIAHLID